MIGTITRKISDTKLRNVSCSHCKETNTLELTVFSKIFLLRILPFVYGKSTQITCSKCKKVYDNYDSLDYNTKQKIEDIKKETHHHVGFYLVYLVLGILMIYGMMIKKA